jgi:hypothetical protein
VEFVWTPTNASWLNLIEPWFLVLEKTALHNTDLKTTEAIAEHLLRGIDYLQRASKTVSVAEGALNIVLLMNRTTSSRASSWVGSMRNWYTLRQGIVSAIRAR